MRLRDAQHEPAAFGLGESASEREADARAPSGVASIVVVVRPVPPAKREFGIAGNSVSFVFDLDGERAAGGPPPDVDGAGAVDDGVVEQRVDNVQHGGSRSAHRRRGILDRDT